MKVYEIIQEQAAAAVASLATSQYGGAALIALQKVMSISYSASTTYPPALTSMMNKKWTAAAGLTGMITHAEMINIIFTWYLRTAELDRMLQSGEIQQGDYDGAYRMLAESTIATLAASTAFKMFIKMIANMIAKKQLNALKGTLLFNSLRIAGGSLLVLGNLTSAAFLYWAQTEAGEKAMAALVMKVIDPAGISLWNQFIVPFTGGEKVKPITDKAKEVVANIDLTQTRDASKDPQVITTRLPGQLPGGQKRGGPPNAATDTPVPPSLGHDFIGSKVSGFDPKAVTAFGNRKSQ